MTRVCCMCKPHHIISKDDGSGIMTHGCCTWAYIKESAKFYWGRLVQFSILVWGVMGALAYAFAVLYLMAHLLLWASRGFPIYGAAAKAELKQAAITTRPAPTNSTSEVPMRPKAETGLK